MCSSGNAQLDELLFDPEELSCDVDDLLNNLGQDCESQQTHITGESLTDDTEVPGTAVVAISHHEGGSFDRQAIIEDAVMTTKAKQFCYYRGAGTN